MRLVLKTGKKSIREKVNVSRILADLLERWSYMPLEYFGKDQLNVYYVLRRWRYKDTYIFEIF